MKKVLSLLAMLLLFVSFVVPASGSGLKDRKYSQYLYYKQKTAESVEEYRQARDAFASLLYIDHKLSAKVVPNSDVYNDLFELANTMTAALENGITNVTSQQILYVDYLFDTDVYVEQDQESDPLYASMLSLYTSVYDIAIEELQAKNDELNDALISAFENKVLDNVEHAGLTELIDALDAILELVYPSELRDK